MTAASKAAVNKMKYDLDLEDLKNKSLEAKSSKFLGTIVGAAIVQQIKLQSAMGEILGTQATQMLMGIVGKLVIPFMIFEGVMMALQYAANQARMGFDSLGSSAASAGMMSANSAAQFIGMSSSLTNSMVGFTSAGYTMKEATALVAKGMEDMSWTLGWTAAQTTSSSSSLQEQTVIANERTTQLTMDMGRMSTVMFGSTDQLKRFVDVSKYFNITTTEGVKVFGTGIGMMSSRLHLDAGNMMDTINGMGKTLLGTGVGIDSLNSTFIPLIENISKMGKAGKLTTFETNTLLEGVKSLSSGVDTFLYMAASGKGNLEKDYATALTIDPITRAKSILDTLSKQGMTTTDKAIATQQMGLFTQLPDAMRMKMIEAFKDTNTVNALKGGNNVDEMRKILGVAPGKEDMWAQISTGILAGKDIQGQMLETLMKMLTAITTGFMGMLKGKDAGAISKLQDIKIEDTASRPGDSAYKANISGSLRAY
jgi:hypothetical protein